MPEQTLVEDAAKIPATTVPKDQAAAKAPPAAAGAGGAKGSGGDAAKVIADKGKTATLAEDNAALDADEKAAAAGWPASVLRLASSENQ